jgi:hypothetical protein
LLRGTYLVTIASMNPQQLTGAFLLAAASLLATGASAQNPNAAPQGKANAADKAEKAADKAAGKPEKADDKAAKPDDKAAKAADNAADKAEKANAGEDRASRKSKEHEAQRQKLKAVLKGPMDEALKQALRRHAERLARLERIKAVAQTEKDTATVEKATTLIGKENERHERWMNKHVAIGAADPPGAGATPTPAADTKGGAK